MSPFRTRFVAGHGAVSPVRPPGWPAARSVGRRVHLTCGGAVLFSICGDAQHSSFSSSCSCYCACHRCRSHIDYLFVSLINTIGMERSRRRRRGGEVDTRGREREGKNETDRQRQTEEGTERERERERERRMKLLLRAITCRLMINDDGHWTSSDEYEM